MPSALNFCTGSSHQQMRMARKAIARAASTRDLAMAPDGGSLFSARRVLSVIDEFTLGTLSSDSSPGHGTILLGRRLSASSTGTACFRRRCRRS